MPNCRTGLVLAVMICLLAGASAFSFGETTQSQASDSEQAIWKLEHAYWDYVEENDLASYRNLWHESFLGWPAVSAAPLGKDHITDWITSQTAKGLAFKSVVLKPAQIQVTGNLAVTCYWITYSLQDKDGKGSTHTLRVTHTWLKQGRDWRIIGGMSAPELATQ